VGRVRHGELCTFVFTPLYRPFVLFLKALLTTEQPSRILYTMARPLLPRQFFESVQALKLPVDAPKMALVHLNVLSSYTGRHTLRSTNASVHVLSPYAVFRYAKYIRFMQTFQSR